MCIEISGVVLVVSVAGPLVTALKDQPRTRPPFPRRGFEFQAITIATFSRSRLQAAADSFEIKTRVPTRNSTGIRPSLRIL